MSGITFHRFWATQLTLDDKSFEDQPFCFGFKVLVPLFPRAVVKVIYQILGADSALSGTAEATWGRNNAVNARFHSLNISPAGRGRVCLKKASFRTYSLTCHVAELPPGKNTASPAFTVNVPVSVVRVTSPSIICTVSSQS